MMNKHIFYYLMVGSMALLLGACNGLFRKQGI